MLNSCNFIGNIGKDPEVRATKDGGKSFTTFSIAVNKPGADRDAKPLWVGVTAFGSAGEFAGKYLKAGNRVYVQGPIELHEYEKDGVTRQILKMVANQLLSLTPKGENGAATTAAAPAKTQAKQSAAPVTDEDIPF